ncbi:MAG: hypothetical protein LBU58_01060, partial [Clostridiales bacterium]|nr:hypothetical protein [Clostridiales bacterium]
MKRINLVLLSAFVSLSVLLFQTPKVIAQAKVPRQYQELFDLINRYNEKQSNINEKDILRVPQDFTVLKQGTGGRVKGAPE